MVLDDAVSHHLLKVTLVPRGHRVMLFCGDAEVEAELVGVEDGRAVLEGRGPARRVASDRRLVLLVGLPRKPAWERILRMGTELGVSEFRPFVARHSVAKGDKVARWSRICEEAARQCGRGSAPSVRAPDSSGLFDGLPSRRLVLQPGAPVGAPEAGDMALLIGPEGGLHPDELEQAQAAGFVAAGLGDWVLRSDTAAVAALARYSVSSMRTSMD